MWLSDKRCTQCSLELYRSVSPLRTSLHLVSYNKIIWRHGNLFHLPLHIIKVPNNQITASQRPTDNAPTLSSPPPSCSSRPAPSVWKARLVSWARGGSASYQCSRLLPQSAALSSPSSLWSSRTQSRYFCTVIWALKFTWICSEGSYLFCSARFTSPSAPFHFTPTHFCTFEWSLPCPARTSQTLSWVCRFDSWVPQFGPLGRFLCFWAFRVPFWVTAKALQCIHRPSHSSEWGRWTPSIWKCTLPCACCTFRWATRPLCCSSASS